MKEQYNKHIYFLMYTTLFLGSLRFLVISDIVGIFFVLICFMLLCSVKSGIPLCNELILVIGFSITYSLITKYNRIPAEGFYLFVPILFYLVGFKIAQIEEYHKNFLINVVYCIAFGRCVRVFLSFFLNRALQQGRDVVDIWTGQVMGATYINNQCIFIISILYFLLRYEKYKYKKIIGLVSVILSLYIALFTSTRTNIGMILVMFLLGILFDMKMIGSRKWIHEGFSNIKSLSILFFLIAILLLFQDKIGSFIVATPLVNRVTTYVSIGKDPRWELMNSVWTNISNYPLGKMPLFYAHNIFLDCLRVSGIYPTIFLVLFILSGVKNIFRMLTLRIMSASNRLLIIILYTGLIISFQFEPVLEGIPFSFLILCMLTGILKFWTDKLISYRLIKGVSS